VKERACTAQKKYVLRAQARTYAPRPPESHVLRIVMCKVSEQQETPLLSWITSLLGKISCPQFDPILRELNLCSYFRCSMSIPNANNPENQFHFLAPRVCWRPNDAACRSCSILQAFTNLLDTGIPQPRQKMIRSLPSRRNWRCPPSSNNYGAGLMGNALSLRRFQRG
jgi:hypothetical protein